MSVDMGISFSRGRRPSGPARRGTVQLWCQPTRFRQIKDLAHCVIIEITLEGCEGDNFVVK